MIYLFGSSLHDPAQARDIDLGVKGINPALFFKFYGELMRHLSKPVDLVDLSQRTLFNDLVEERRVKIYGWISRFSPFLRSRLWHCFAGSTLEAVGTKTTGVMAALYDGTRSLSLRAKRSNAFRMILRHETFYFHSPNPIFWHNPA